MGKAPVYLRNSDDFSLFYGFSDKYLRLSQNGQSFSRPYFDIMASMKESRDACCSAVKRFCQSNIFC